MNKKRVNIYPRGPIVNTNPPIRGVVKGVTKDISDIRRCIIAGAKVEEVRQDGQVVLLDLRNYDMDTSDCKITDRPIPTHTTSTVELKYESAVGSDDALPSDNSEVKTLDQQAEAFAITIPVNENIPADDENPEDATVDEKANNAEQPVAEEQQRLTKKQRRALRAKELSAAISIETNDDEPEEVVETQDAEEM